MQFRPGPGQFSVLFVCCHLAQYDAQSSALCHYLQKYPVKLNSSNGHNKLSNKILSTINDCYVKEVAKDQEE